jgi:hypothetical protein
MNNDDWKQCVREMPPEGVAVETKIDDAKGCRNVQPLIRSNRLWWVQDMSVYVYYTPTHWRPL